MSAQLVAVDPPNRVDRLGRRPDAWRWWRCSRDSDRPSGTGRVDRRCLGSTRLAGTFCDIGHPATLAHLRGTLAGRLVHYGLDDLDAGDVRRRWPRRFTQDVSRLVFEQGADGGRAFAGIRSSSRLGDEIDNWVIFKPTELHGAHSEPIDDDPDLLMALARFGPTPVWPGRGPRSRSRAAVDGHCRRAKPAIHRRPSLVALGRPARDTLRRDPGVASRVKVRGQPGCRLKNARRTWRCCVCLRLSRKSVLGAVVENGALRG